MDFGEDSVQLIAQGLLQYHRCKGHNALHQITQYQGGHRPLFRQPHGFPSDVHNGLIALRN